MGLRGQQPIYSPVELASKFKQIKLDTGKNSVNFAYKWLGIDRKTLYNYKRNQSYSECFKILSM